MDAVRERDAPGTGKTAGRAPLLDVRNLRVEFGSLAAPFRAVDGVDLTIDAGELVGVVGESGSGKSVTALALMGLVDEPGRVRADHMRFDGRDLLAMPLGERRGLLGRDIAAHRCVGHVARRGGARLAGHDGTEREDDQAGLKACSDVPEAGLKTRGYGCPHSASSRPVLSPSMS